MLSVVIVVDEDEVGKADEMSMMYKSDASCTSYTACYITNHDNRIVEARVCLV